MNKIILLVMGVILVSCSQRATPRPAIPLTSSPPITPAPSLIPEDTFEVEAWVDNPMPSRDTRVIIRGSLIKNGVRLGGMMMQATWPEETQERGVPNCRVLVTYGSGVCVVPVKNYEPGVFVPVTVTFDYGGMIHIGHTGFTPQ
jgi:hypothetical protein